MAARPRSARLVEHGPAIAAVRARRNKAKLSPAVPGVQPADRPVAGSAATVARQRRAESFITPQERPVSYASPFDERVRNTCGNCLRPFEYRVGDGYTDRCPKCLREIVEWLETDVANLTAEEESLADAQAALESKEGEVEEMKKEIEALQSRVSEMETELHDALDLVEKMKERSNGKG